MAGRAPGFVARSVRERGVRDGLNHVRHITEWRLAAGLSRNFVDKVYNPGRPIWDAAAEWDVLVVLDACRVDLMRELAGEYAFVGGPANVDARWSVASKSNDWLRRTFAPEHATEVRRTAYVTGNPFTAKAILPVEPAATDEVWTYAWDDDLRTVPARALTDRAIATWRDRSDDVDRMVVHYMQPHAPFVDRPDLGDYGGPDAFGEGLGNVWAAIGDGISLEEMWALYRDNLRYALDDVAILLDNLDAERVVLTADHGNGVGEFGVYGHPSDLLVPAVRRVPWVETTARDTGDHDPATWLETTDDATTDADVQDRLQALGYAE